MGGLNRLHLMKICFAQSCVGTPLSLVCVTSYEHNHSNGFLFFYISFFSTITKTYVAACPALQCMNLALHSHCLFAHVAMFILQ